MIVHTTSGAVYRIECIDGSWRFFRTGPKIKEIFLGGSIEENWVELAYEPDPWPPQVDRPLRFRPRYIEPIHTSPVVRVIEDTPGS